MRILFLGQNPSTSAPDKAFTSTRSGAILLKLISLTSLPTQNIKFANVLNYATQKNKPPKKSEFVKRGKEDSFGKLLSEFDIIYVCGELPKVAVHWAREYFWLGKVRFVFIPHPSPKNRVWNDPQMFEIVAKSIGAEYENTVFEKLEKNKERCLP